MVKKTLEQENIYLKNAILTLENANLRLRKREMYYFTVEIGTEVYLTYDGKYLPTAARNVLDIKKLRDIRTAKGLITESTLTHITVEVTNTERTWEYVIRKKDIISLKKWSEVKKISKLPSADDEYYCNNTHERGKIHDGGKWTDIVEQYPELLDKYIDEVREHYELSNEFIYIFKNSRQDTLGELYFADTEEFNISWRKCK